MKVVLNSIFIPSSEGVLRKTLRKYSFEFEFDRKHYLSVYFY